MNEFLFWCRHPLVRILFHEVTSLHPRSFQRNDFSICSYIMHNFLCTSTSRQVVAHFIAHVCGNH